MLVRKLAASLIQILPHTLGGMLRMRLTPDSDYPIPCRPPGIGSQQLHDSRRSSRSQPDELSVHTGHVSHTGQHTRWFPITSPEWLTYDLHMQTAASVVSR